MSTVGALGQGANLPNRTQLIQSLNRRESRIEAEGTLEVGSGPLLQGTSRNRDDFAGRYINQQGGSRLFNTGTDERGRYVNGYSVVGEGRSRTITPEYLRPASEAPRSILTPPQAREHLELETTGQTDAQGKPIYRRDGFVGDYTVREDGSIFFGGGYHRNGGRGRINLPAQTYINGRWYRGEMPVGTSTSIPPGSTAPPGIGIPPGNTAPPAPVPLPPISGPSTSAQGQIQINGNSTPVQIQAQIQNGNVQGQVQISTGSGSQLQLQVQGNNVSGQLQASNRSPQVQIQGQVTQGRNGFSGQFQFGSGSFQIQGQLNSGGNGLNAQLQFQGDLRGSLNVLNGNASGQLQINTPPTPPQAPPVMPPADETPETLPPPRVMPPASDTPETLPPPKVMPPVDERTSSARPSGSGLWLRERGLIGDEEFGIERSPSPPTSSGPTSNPTNPPAGPPTPPDPVMIKQDQAKLKQAETDLNKRAQQEIQNTDALIKVTDKSHIPEIDKAKQRFVKDMEEANTLIKKGELVKAAKKETEALVNLKKVTLKAELTDTAYKEKIQEGRKLIQEKQSKNITQAEDQELYVSGIDRSIQSTKNNEGLGIYEYLMLGPFVSRTIDYVLVDKKISALREEQKDRVGLAEQYRTTAEELGKYLTEADKLKETKDYKAELAKIEEGVKRLDETNKQLKIDSANVNKKASEMLAQVSKNAETIAVAAEQTEKGLRIAKEKFAEYAAKIVSKRTGVPEEFCKLAILSLSNLGELAGDIASGNKTSENALTASLDRLIDDCVNTLANKLISKGFDKIKLPKTWENSSPAKTIEGKVKDKAKDIIKSVLSKGMKQTMEELRRDNPDDFSESLEKILRESIMETIQEKIPFYKGIIELKDKL